MRHGRWSILVFAIGAALMTGALVWLTMQAVELERREARARADAKFQEAIRLALWRMESTLAPIIARESSRPYFQYRSFYPAGRAYNAMRSDAKPGEVVVPSPLLAGPQEPILLHFEQDASGACSSPQVPGSEFVSLAESTYASKYELEVWKQRLGDFSRLNDAVKEPTAGPVSTIIAGPPVVNTPAPANALVGQVEAGDPTVQTRNDSQVRAMDESQVAQSVNEYSVRQQIANRSNMQTKVWESPNRREGEPSPKAAAVELESKAGEGVDRDTMDKLAAANAEAKDADGELALGKGESGAAAYDGPPVAGDVVSNASGANGLEEAFFKKEAGDSPRAVDETVVVQGELVASWIETEDAEPTLVLARDVSIGGSTIRQGVWLDWTQLRASLLASAGDVLPGATLQPAALASNDLTTLGRRLAAIPAELVVPDPPEPVVAAWSPVRTTLAGAWVVALVAAIAIGLVLRASWELAERRGRFVTAVTHELRTPLTTFCLYSQMLAEGMVPDESRRKEYFNTLRTESQRLSRIVESVLDYARLGRNTASRQTKPVPLGEFVDQLVGTLAARCEQAGMTLVVERSEDADRAIATDPPTVERILYNLVDNACKYAATSDDRRVHFEVRVGGADVILAVRDHGPGVEKPEQSSIFRPFVRGKRHGDGSISGLGLGLALARGLADQLGGELSLEGAPGTGAEFRLRLPLAA